MKMIEYTIYRWLTEEQEEVLEDYALDITDESEIEKDGADVINIIKTLPAIWKNDLNERLKEIMPNYNRVEAMIVLSNLSWDDIKPEIDYAGQVAIIPLTGVTVELIGPKIFSSKLIGRGDLIMLSVNQEDKIRVTPYWGQHSDRIVFYVCSSL